MRLPPAIVCLGFICLLSCTQTPITNQQASLIGGTPDNQHPAIGALLSNLRSYCTGTLITPKLVLTAAHCIESARQLQARGLRLQYRVDIPTQSAYKIRYYDVASMHTHPQYSGNNAATRNQSDIGVVILAQNVPDAPPLLLHTQPMPNTWINRKLSFWGYGLLETRPQPKSASSKHFLQLTLRQIQLDRFEMQDKDKSICSGDSGGPALYEVNGKLRIVGVNSYVVGGTDGSQPRCDGAGFAFRTDAYFSWLLPFLIQNGWQCKDNEDCGNCATCQAGTCAPKQVTTAPKLCRPCHKDSDCGGGLCTTTPAGRRCTQSCSSSGCCPTGYSCQFIGQNVRQCFPSTGTCPVASCQSDPQCGPGEQCSGGQCSPKKPTPAGYRCLKCKQKSDCQGGTCHTFPDGGHCVQPCEGDLFCPNGDTCRLVEGARICVPESGQCPCQNNDQCHEDYRCRDAICQPGEGGKHGTPCNDDAPCAKAHLCVATSKGNTCAATCGNTFPLGLPGSLCDNKQCLHKSRCYGVSGKSICLLACQQVSDCPFGGTCDKISGLSLCTCNADADCKSGSACNKDTIESFGVCAPTPSSNPCPNKTQCLPYIAGTSLCQPDGTRPTGTSCTKGELCQWGLRCINLDESAYCARDCSSHGACEPEGGTCTQVPGASLCFCKEDSNCSPGYICQKDQGNGICTQAECLKSSDCTAPQSCQKGRCHTPTNEPTLEPTTPELPDSPGEKDARIETPTPKKGCGCSALPSHKRGAFWWVGLFVLLCFCTTRPKQWSD